METMGLEKFISDFTVSDEQLNEIVQSAKENGVIFNGESFDRSKERLRLLTKAYIGRSVWENKGFYPIINQQNEIFIRALDLFDEAELLARTSEVID